METVETLFKKIGQLGSYFNETRPAKYIYSTHAWNAVRRNIYGTFVVDKILDIGETCEYNPKEDYYCKHLVRYEYNGNVQVEVFDAQQILQFCRQLNYPLNELGEHFSVQALVKNNQEWMRMSHQETLHNTNDPNDPNDTTFMPPPEISLL